MASGWLQRKAEQLKQGMRAAGLVPDAEEERPRPRPPPVSPPAPALTPAPAARATPKATGGSPPTASPGPASPSPTSSAAGEWVCDRCTFLNAASATTCDACGYCAWAAEDAPLAGWTCTRCTFVNTHPGSTCEVCNAQSDRSCRRGSVMPGGGWTCRRCTFNNCPKDACCDACGSTEGAPQAAAPPALPVVAAPPPSPPRSSSSPTSPGNRAGSPADGPGWVKSSGLDMQLRQQETDADRHIANQCSLARAAGQLFVDDDFPACDRSLYGERGRVKLGRGIKGGDYEWKRASSLAHGWAVIGQSISPDDILQGELGDCWFLSALSVLADRPHLIDRILLTKKYNREGAYAVRFFHEGDWKRVIVDDFFPTKHRQLAFGHCRHPQLWVSIIEKAYAKLHGSYAAIVAGQSFNALFDLTGAPCESISLEKDGLDLELLWAQLLSFKQSNFLLAAACCRKGASEEYLAQMGLVQFHAYALVDVRAESGFKLVKLRNPWGRTEWNGDWGRRSQRWTPEWRRQLDYHDDSGTFWMSYGDFVVHFGTVDVCKEQAAWHSLSLPASIPTASSFPDVMFELNAPATTWLFAMLIQQRPQRGEGRDADYADMALLVLEDGPDPGQRRLVTQIWPGLDRVSHVDFLTVRDQPRYLLVPYSTGARPKALPFTFAVYSAHPVSVRPVPFSPSPLRQHLTLAVTTACHAQQPHPGVFLYSLQKGSAVFIVVVNRDPSDYVTIEVDSVGSSNLTSSRGKLLTRDTLPPQTRQLVAILSQQIGTHSFVWKMKCSVLKMPSGLWHMQGRPTQSPALLGPGDLHEPQSLRPGRSR